MVFWSQNVLQSVHLIRDFLIWMHLEKAIIMNNLFIQIDFVSKLERTYLLQLLNCAANLLFLPFIYDEDFYSVLFNLL